MFTKAVKTVSRTAGEALEINAYNRLLKRYTDPQVVKAIIENELRASEETWETFNTYLRFKSKVQNDQISIVRAAKEAELLAKDYLNEAGLGGS